MDTTQISNWLINIVDHTRRTIDLHVPSDVIPGPDWAGLTLVALGLLVGVYGAHYARGMITVVLGGFGYVLGTLAAERFQIQQPIIGGVAGAVILALLTYTTFRLWIGLAVAVLAATVGLSIFGHDSVWPAFLDYQPQTLAAQAPEGEYALPSAADQQANLDPNPASFLQGFYKSFKAEQPEIASKGTLITVLCFAGGFLLGVLGAKLALIIAAAVGGTMLFAAGLASFAEAWAPGGWESRLSAHPVIVVSFIGAALLMSLLVQLRLSRSHSRDKSVEKPAG